MVTLIAHLFTALALFHPIGVHRHHAPPTQACPSWVYLDSNGHAVRPACADPGPIAHPGWRR